MTMAKQAAIFQTLVVCVDKTDFASVESGVTSNFTLDLYSVKQGVSTAASANTSLSRVPSVVHSGIIRVTLEAAETSGLDFALLKIAHASCADQYIPISFEGQDISNYLSDISAIVSDTLSNVQSGFVATSNIISDILSNVQSGFVAQSAAISDMHSDLGSAIGGVASDVWGANPSSISAASTVGSLMVKFQNSAVAATIAASDISDIASAVWAFNPSTMSAASTIGSLVVKMLPDISNVVSDILSNVQSGFVTTSAALSDIDSQLLLNASVISDIDSQLTVTDATVSDILSNVQSGFVATSAAISDLDSQVLLNASVISDIDSQLTVTHSLLSDVDSQVLLNASVISDIDSQLTVNTSTLSDIDSMVTDMSNILSDLSSRVPTGTGFAAAGNTIVKASINADIAITASNFATTLTETTNSHYNGRVLIFTTGDLADQAATVSDYTGASSQLQVTDLTESPASGDSFVIV